MSESRTFTAYTGLVPFAEDGTMQRTGKGAAQWREVPPFESTMECWGYDATWRFYCLHDRTTRQQWPCSPSEWERMEAVAHATPGRLRWDPDWHGIWGVQRYGRAYGLVLLEPRLVWHTFSFG